MSAKGQQAIVLAALPTRISKINEVVSSGSLPLLRQASL
jgi:hypothetical protein